MSGKTLTKFAIAKFHQGLFRIPEDLTKKLKHNSKEEVRQKEELEQFKLQQEARLIEACHWLSADGCIVFDTINQDQYNRLKLKDRGEYVKIGSLTYSKTCTVRRGNEGELIAGLVGKDDKTLKYEQKVLPEYKKQLDEWNKLDNARKQLAALRRNHDDLAALAIVRDQTGFRATKLLGPMPKKPIMPKAPVCEKKHHVVRTIRISLIRIITTNTVVFKKITKMGKTTKKKIYKEVVTREKVHEMIAPLDNDIHAKEIPMVVAEVCARLPRGGVIPQWDQYEYSIEG